MHVRQRAYVQVSPGWSPLHHACFAGLCTRARELLLLGADERMCSAPPEPSVTPLQLAQQAQDSQDQLATPIQQLLQRAMLPWSPREQALFPPVLRGQALVLMLVHRRLCLAATLGSPVDGVERVIKRQRLTTLPELPRAVWLLVVGFAVRRCELEVVRALGFPHVN